MIHYLHAHLHNINPLLVLALYVLCCAYCIAFCIDGLRILWKHR